jgi:hypothetical protein
MTNVELDSFYLSRDRPSPCGRAIATIRRSHSPSHHGGWVIIDTSTRLFNNQTTFII